MEAYREEARRAKENAEKRFSMRDYVGAKDYAMKAQMLYPDLEGISQMVSTFGVYLSSEVKVSGEPDCYTLLGLDPSAGKVKVKKQYRKMASLLHPDTNKTLGADGAFKLISDAWLCLSDAKKRRKFDRKRKKQGVVQPNLSSVFSAPAASHGLDTFWTVCTSCQVQYEYLRKYLNKKLSCKNCRGVFVAVETGTGPVNGAFPYSNWSYAPANNGYGSHGYNNGITYPPKTDLYFTENAPSEYHSGHNSEYVSNVSFQWGAHSGAVNPSPNGVRAKSKVNGKRRGRNGGTEIVSNVLIGYSEPSASKGVRAHKKRRLERGLKYRSEELVPKSNSNINVVNGYENVVAIPKPEVQSEMLTRRFLSDPRFDARKLLMEKAKGEICKKLEEMNVSLGETQVGNVSEKKAKTQTGSVLKTGNLKTGTIRKRNTRRLELRRTGSMPITVPDSDFHDFDKDRSEECFKPKQIWTIYDEEDGMPRLYCLIRDVISIKPFKIQISYLNAKTDTEFGDVKWVVYGFTKSCGNFRAFNSDIVEEVNLFSHLLEKEKAGRGGCVRIYPRSGDIWAVYRNWSEDWNKKTPYEVRHQYEMVEVLDDYSEDLGLCVAPLVKIDGYKTVYQRVGNKDAIRWIPRKEMLRFSHQVPSWSLNGDDADFPDGCWDLDPAATPDELLQGSGEIIQSSNDMTQGNGNMVVQKSSDFKSPDEMNQCKSDMIQGSSDMIQGSIDLKTPDELLHGSADMIQGTGDLKTPDELLQGSGEMIQGMSDFRDPDELFGLSNMKTPGELLQDLSDIW